MKENLVDFILVSHESFFLIIPHLCKGKLQVPAGKHTHKNAQKF